MCEAVKAVAAESIRAASAELVRYGPLSRDGGRKAQPVRFGHGTLPSRKLPPGSAQTQQILLE